MKITFKIIFTCCFITAILTAHGQELTFFSPVVEEGVRKHLNIAEDEQIHFLQLDTITTLDLSMYGVTDIRDLVLLPKLRNVDLSDNIVEDLQPLTVLDSLEWVDLSYNRLKSVNDLFYSSSKEMTIIVSFNYINDFSLFTSLSSCNFTLIGTGLQYNENALRFEVNQLYSEIDEYDQPIITYHGYTNLMTAFNFKCASINVPALLDGETYDITIKENITKTTPVYITNGKVGDSTFIVPPKEFTADAGETITLETGLPEDYRLSSAFATNGLVEIEGNTIKYTASQTALDDVVNFAYYQESTFKGLSRFYINREPREDILGDVNNDGAVDISDYIGVANYILGSPPAGFNATAADVNSDGSIDISDYIGVANIILTGKP